MTNSIVAVDRKFVIEGMKKVLAKKLAEYILTDADQSLVYRGKLLSLPYTYHLFINDPDGMASQVKEDVEYKLRSSFFYVDVSTEVELSESDSSARILLFATVIDDAGNKEGLGNVVEIDPDGLKKVVEIINYGDGLGFLGRM